MKQNEPVEALRTLSATIYTVAGTLLPEATTWLAGMVRISKGGGAFANSTNLPTSVSGGGDGDFDLILTVSEVDTIGNLRIRFFDDAIGTNLLAEYVDQVVASTTAVSTSSSSSLFNFGVGSILKADVLAIAPALSALSDWAWLTILTYVNTFKGLDADPALKRIALIFLAAHLGTVSGSSGTGATGATGPVVSESAGGLKRSYGQFKVDSSTGSLAQTAYGMQYLSILGTSPHLAGPFLI